MWTCKDFKDDPEDRFGVDLSLTEGKCISNHVTQISYMDEIVNEQDVNMNNIEWKEGRIIHGSGICYFGKYNLNTILLSMSVLDVPLPKDDESKSIILAIDSAFQAFYSKHPNDVRAIYRYLKILGFEELIDFMKQKDEQYFKNITEKYGLKSKIFIKNGKLTSSKNLTGLRNKLKLSMGIDIKLPQQEFEVTQHFGVQAVEIPRNIFLTKQEPIDRGVKLYSLAITGRYYMKTSYYI
ncbi:hypothetical protein [Clostridium acidisoli]|uniref:hypothetical protein n=1 Tax=Clostridium acidisoli TaxID=91624 RepID=UPI00111C585D|nr:hypothetical protein [Clostridium acidisoli]